MCGSVPKKSKKFLSEFSQFVSLLDKEQLHLEQCRQTN